MGQLLNNFAWTVEVACIMLKRTSIKSLFSYILVHEDLRSYRPKIF